MLQLAICELAINGPRMLRREISYDLSLTINSFYFAKKKKKKQFLLFYLVQLGMKHKSSRKKKCDCDSPNVLANEGGGAALRHVCNDLLELFVY